MTSIYQQACNEIFQVLDALTEEDRSRITVTVSFIEVAGEEVHDLMNNFTTVQLAPGNDESTFHAYPIVEPTVDSAEGLFSLIMYCCGSRATAATGVHDASSRSHAVLRIYIRKTIPSNSRQASFANRYNQVQDTVVEGVVTLVDLAGSEHKIDSMYHSAERRKEGAEINASLMTLKECIRIQGLVKNPAKAQKYNHIYRKSKLTKVLKGSFVLPNASTHIIATVSPASKDTEHSLNTLRHASLMMSKNSGKEEEDEETRFITGV